jgi:hypothetical protein
MGTSTDVLGRPHTDARERLTRPVGISCVDSVDTNDSREGRVVMPVSVLLKADRVLPAATGRSEDRPVDGRRRSESSLREDGPAGAESDAVDSGISD